MQVIDNEKLLLLILVSKKISLTLVICLCNRVENVYKKLGSLHLYTVADFIFFKLLKYLNKNLTSFIINW